MILGMIAAVVVPFILGANDIFFTDGIWWAINVPSVIAATAVGCIMERG